MALSVDTTPAKHVTVLRNGDGKYEGRKFVVSRRRYRTFDALLSDITHQISAPFGAVRRLYTPKGSRQIRGIDDLEGGATYVAGGNERFKRINYNPQQSAGKNWGLSSHVKPGFLADDPPPLVLPKKNKKYAQRSAQFHKVRQPVQFTVYRNGLQSDKGTRFLLKAREMKSFETVLSIISFKIRLVEGAVRKLFTLEGSIIHGPEEITDGGQYVACGHRRFIAAPYGEMPQPVRSNQKLPMLRKHRDSNQPSPRTQSNPLPAIPKKTTEKKARSEKDSPAPIEEDKGNDEVMVVVSRGSQADVGEDDSVALSSGLSSGPSASGSVALAVDSPENQPTPPPNPHVNYDNDLHDANDYSYDAENQEELTDGEIPGVESENEGLLEVDIMEHGDDSSLANFNPMSESAGRSEISSAVSRKTSAASLNPVERSPTPAFDEDELETAENDIPKEDKPIVNETPATENGGVPPEENRTVTPPEENRAVTPPNIENDISETVVETVPSKNKLPAAKKTNQAVSSEEAKSVPSKSKLDRNPPKKKGNSELLINGTEGDAVFNATADTRPVNTDGQFLMNNVNEEESKKHDADEIEEDGELVEDKPIDLQQAEEIVEEEPDVLNPRTDRRPSTSTT